jgi:hypothetical protein
MHEIYDKLAVINSDMAVLHERIDNLKQDYTGLSEYAHEEINDIQEKYSRIITEIQQITDQLKEINVSRETNTKVRGMIFAGIIVSLIAALVIGMWKLIEPHIVNPIPNIDNHKSFIVNHDKK